MDNRSWPTKCLILAMTTLGVALPASASPPPATFRAYCFTCHGKAAMGGINLELLSSSAIGDHFQRWEKVAAALVKYNLDPAKPNPMSV